MSVQALNRKEAIISGEDITPVTREEYYLKGLAEGQGGGGLDYVIPEQTVTFQNGTATLQNLNVSGLQNNEHIIMKNIMPGDVISYVIATFYEEDGDIAFPPDSEMGAIDTNTGLWTSEAPDNMTVTVSAIRGF